MTEYKKILDNEVNDPTSRLLLATDSTFKSVVSNRLIENYNKKNNDRTKFTSVRISYRVTVEEENSLVDDFPEFNLEFSQNINNSHSVAAAYRRLCNEILLHRTNYHRYDNKTRNQRARESGKDVYLKDIGGNYTYYLDRNYGTVHCCCPLVEQKDSQRWVERKLAVTNFLSDESRQISSNQTTSAYNCLDVARGKIDLSKDVCRLIFSECSITSVYAILQDSCYGIGLRHLGDGLTNSQVDLAYGSYIFSPMMLQSFSGYIPTLKVYWTHVDIDGAELDVDDDSRGRTFHDVSEILSKSKTIRFTFEGDSSYNYEHNTLDYLAYVMVENFTDSRGTRYTLEMQENRGGYQFFKICRVHDDLQNRVGIDIFRHDLWSGVKGNMILVTAFEINFDRYKDGLYPSTVMNSRNVTRQWSESDDNNLLRINRFWAPAELVEKTLCFAHGVTEAKFKPEEIFNFIKSVNSRNPTSNGVSMPDYRLTYKEISQLTICIYLTVYNAKFNGGKIMQQVISDVNYDRNYEYKGFFSCLIDWIMGNGSSRKVHIKLNSKPKFYHRLFNLVHERLLVSELIQRAPNRIVVGNTLGRTVKIIARHGTEFILNYSTSNISLMEVIMNFVHSVISPVVVDGIDFSDNPSLDFLVDGGEASGAVIERSGDLHQYLKDHRGLDGMPSEDLDDAIIGTSDVDLDVAYDVGDDIDDIMRTIHCRQLTSYRLVISRDLNSGVLYRLLKHLLVGFFVVNIEVLDRSCVGISISRDGNETMQRALLVKFLEDVYRKSRNVDFEITSQELTVINVGNYYDYGDISPEIGNETTEVIRKYVDDKVWDCTIGVDSDSSMMSLLPERDSAEMIDRKLALLDKVRSKVVASLNNDNYDTIMRLVMRFDRFKLIIPLGISVTAFSVIMSQIALARNISYARRDDIIVLDVEMFGRYKTPHFSRLYKIDRVASILKEVKNMYLYLNLTTDSGVMCADEISVYCNQSTASVDSGVSEERTTTAVGVTVEAVSEIPSAGKINFVDSCACKEGKYSCDDVVVPLETTRGKIIDSIESAGKTTGTVVVAGDEDSSCRINSGGDAIASNHDPSVIELTPVAGIHGVDVALGERESCDDDIDMLCLLEPPREFCDIEDTVDTTPSRCRITSRSITRSDLELIERNVRDVPGDGNCLYYSLTSSVSIDVKRLRSRLKDLNDGFYDSSIFVGYGGREVMDTYAFFLNVKIIVYDLNDDRVVIIEPDVIIDSVEIVYRLEHYAIIRKRINSRDKCREWMSVDINVLKRLELTDAVAYNHNSLVYNKGYKTKIAKTFPRNIGKLYIFANTSSSPIEPSGYAVEKLERDGVVFYKYEKFGDKCCIVEVVNGRNVNVVKNSKGYILELPIRSDRFIIDLDSARKNLISIYDRIPSGSQVILNLKSLINVEVLIREFNARRFCGAVAMDEFEDRYGPRYEAGVSNLARMKNAIEEVVWLWKTQRESVKSNIQPNHNRVVASGAGTVVEDVSFGMIDIVNGTWIVRPGNRIEDYQMAFDGEDFVDLTEVLRSDGTMRASERYLLDNPRNRFLSVNRDTRLMLSDRLYFAARACRYGDDELMNLKIVVYNSGPGVGKTRHIIDNHDPLNDLVLTNTKEALLDIRRRVENMYANDEVNLTETYRTGDSFLINNNGRKRYKNVWIDEGFMKHCGEWLLYAMAAKAQCITVMGDSAQIPYIERSGKDVFYPYYGQVFESLSDSVEVRHLNVTKRCPLDVTTWLNESCSYPFKITSTNVKTKTVGCRMIVGVTGLQKSKLADKIVYLTFTQAEKIELLDRGFKALTIHEFQGNQSETVVLVRLNPKVNPVYKSKPHMLVALTRHTKNFVYCTVVADDMYDLVNVIKSYSHSRLNSAKSNMQGGYSITQRPFCYYSEMDDGGAVVMYCENRVSRKFVQDHHETGYIPARPKLYELQVDDYQGEERLLEPIYDVSNPVEIFQYFIDNLLPGSSTEFSEYDSYLYVHNSDCFNTDELMLREDFRVPKFFEPYVHANIRATVPVPVKGVQKEVVKAFMERNGAVPDLTYIVNLSDESDAMLHSFVDTYIGDTELFDRYARNPLNVNTRSLDRWFNTQPPLVRQIIGESDVVVFDSQKFNEYDYILKRVGKIDLDINSQCRNKSPQTIAHLSKEINALFCPVVKDMKDRLFAVLKSNVLINMDMSIGDFERALTYRMMEKFPNKVPEHLEVDFSKFDKSQNLLTLYFELKIMKAFGVSDEFLDLWIVMHVTTNLLNKSCAFKAKVNYQRKSGDAMTYLGNTLFLMAVMSRGFHMSEDNLMLFSGDDSLIYSEREIVQTDLMNACNKFAFVYNLEAKLLRYSYPYFCSKFIIYRLGYGCRVMVDPLKLVVKLGRKDLVSAEHVEMYRVAVVDNISCYSEVDYWMDLDRAVANRYGDVLDIGLVLNAVISVALSPEKFMKLYTINSDNVFDSKNELPSLEI